MCQVGRQARSVIAIGTVAAFSVALNAGFQEIAQAFASANFTGGPHVSHAARPVRLRRMQTPDIDIVRRDLRAGRDRFGFRRWIADDETCLQRLPERREDLEVAARAGLDREGFGQQRAVEALDLYPGSLERCLDPLVQLAGWAIATVPVDGFGACLLDHFGDYLFRAAALQDQGATLCCDPPGQRSQRFVEPPPGCSAGCACLAALFIQHIE